MSGSGDRRGGGPPGSGIQTMPGKPLGRSRRNQGKHLGGSGYQ
ncbi:hypothetical protein U9M48_035296 [Paspalum notatum var. saurae]|uniref:Uncharacterized protein n=1 Tax=Paspalum notatum var. saurae TaxID=547442 RepID=A0AAQ3X8V7_PASNO